MTGDQQDMLARLKSYLPRWFGDASPVIDGVMSGFAWCAQFVYGLIAYVTLQTRIRTATDGNLDMIAGDYFGTALQRRGGQTDASYRAEILANIFREKATRNALIKLAEDVTGRTPQILEVRRAQDSGAYGTNTAFYDSAGQYGGGLYIGPYQCFIKVYRPLPNSLQYGVLDSDILAAIDAVRPTNAIVWVQIDN